MNEALARLQILIDLTGTLEHHTFLNKELQTIKNLINDEQTGNQRYYRFYNHRHLFISITNPFIIRNQMILKPIKLPTDVKITYNKQGNIKSITTPYDNNLTINNPLK